MSVEVRVPPMGESVVEATVGRWLKAEGDAVQAGDSLVELETEKISLQVPSEESGVLEKIVQPEGETVHVGDVLATLANGTAASAARSTADERPPTGVPTRLEAEGLPASAWGDQRPLPSAEAPTPNAQRPTPNAGPSSPVLPPIAPAARRLATEQNVDLSRIRGTGRGGRITVEDVRDFVASAGTEQESEQAVPSQGPTSPPLAPAPGPTPNAQGPTPPLPLPPAVQRPDREERHRLSRRRLTIARRLVEAQQTAAILTTFNEADMTAVMEVRKRRRDAFRERHGVGLGFMSFFTKAAVGALKAFPEVNAELQGEELVLKHYYDIGIAVSTEDGLVVPVLRDADRKSFAEIEKEIADLATRAREKQLTLEELMGGTFTITNGGVFGSLLSTPILNPPQVAILGMHKIQERPIAQGGAVVIHPMMYLALSYDHRVIDGREAVQFLVRIKELIEDPESLLLEG
jgi:2-oxoglutarate dehydrogenase E2 component (dihydrolipoamide succinyltransferase)